MSNNFQPEQNTESVQCETVPEAITQGTHISGLYTKSTIYSDIQINSKVILNSLTD